MAVPKKTVPFVVDAEGRGVAQTLTVGGEHAHVFHADTYPSFGGGTQERVILRITPNRASGPRG